MFYQTEIARKLPSSFTAVTLSPPAATERCRLLLNDIVCSVRRMAHALQYIVNKMIQQFFVFCPW